MLEKPDILKPFEESRQDSEGDYRRLRELLLGKERGELESLHRRLGFVERGEEFLENHLEGGLRRLSTDVEDGGKDALDEIVAAAALDGFETGTKAQREALFALVEPFVKTRLQLTMASERRKRRLATKGLAAAILLLAAIGFVVLLLSLMSHRREMVWADHAAEASAAAGIEVIASRTSGWFGLGERSATALIDPAIPNEALEKWFAQVQLHRIDYRAPSDRDGSIDQRLANVASGAVDLVAISEEQRALELREMTRALFFSHFGAMENVTLEWDATSMRWMPIGQVDVELYEKLREELPEIANLAEIDFSELELSGEQSLNEARRAVEAITLTFVGDTEEMTPEGEEKSARLLEAIVDYETEAERFGLTPPKYEPRVTPVTAAVEQERIASIQLLLRSAEIAIDRLLPGVEAAVEDRKGVFLKVVQDR